jgi:nickel-type superoxide dismutase maturation protease
MLSYFKVREQSMEPWVREGDFVVVDRMSYLFSKPRVGHIVIAKNPRKPSMLLLKRIVKEQEDWYWIEGDNAKKSTDSRHFGWLKRDFLVGKVIHKTGPLAHSIMMKSFVQEHIMS